jgi:chromosome partitioning protein
MGKVIAIANQKGGVGKTTTTINLGASLGLLEFKTLVIDADPQANATSGLGVALNTVEKSIYDCLLNEIDPHEAIVHTKVPNLDIIPGHIDLVGAETELVSRWRREFVLKGIIDQVKDEYDFILIDCLPSLGIVTVNALTASDTVLVPVQCEYFALEGLGKLMNTIRLVRKQLNPELGVEGILLSMYDGRLRLAKDVVEQVRMHFGDKVFDTIIHRNARLSEAPSEGVPIALYDALSKGSINFLNFAKELLLKNELPLRKDVQVEDIQESNMEALG